MGDHFQFSQKPVMAGEFLFAAVFQIRKTGLHLAGFQPYAVNAIVADPCCLLGFIAGKYCTWETLQTLES